jgi:hypothetical protein
MARIRTIKPEFWDDEKIGQLPLGARLLFIGSWNLADDEGILVWNEKYLRARIFPYDTAITLKYVKKWMDHITSLNFIEVYGGANGETYGFILNMTKHQRINRPQKSKHTDIIEAISRKHSVNNHGVFTDDSLLEQGKERKEKERGIGKGLQENETHTPEIISKNTLKEDPLKKQYGEFKNVFLTDEELKKLNEHFGEADAIKRIENLSAGIRSHDYKYKDHYATILTWARRDEKEAANNGSNKQNNKPSWRLPDRNSYTESPDYTNE